MGKKLKWNLVLMSILYLGLGIFLLLVPGTALNIVCYALGGVVLACAAVQLIRYFAVERGVFQSQLTLISGLVCLGLGAFLIIRSDIVMRILPIVFGLFVIFDSLGRIQNALELRRCEYPSWKGFLLLAVLSIVLGVIMIVDPFGTMETLVMAIGVILIVEGSLNLLSALYTVIAVKRFLKLHPETQSMLEAVTGEDLNGDAFDAVHRKQGVPFSGPATNAERKTLLIAGLICGTLLFAASAAQQIGITINPSTAKAGFLTAMYVVLVPVFGLFLGRRGNVQLWLSMVISVGGLYLLCMKNGFGGIEPSDWILLSCAVLFSFQIMAVDHFSPLVDGVRLSLLQFFVVAVESTAAAFLFETPALAEFGANWLPLIYCGVLSSGVAYTLQILGQKELNPAIASLIMCLESVFSALGGWLILHQRLSVREGFGCVLIFAAVVLAQLPVEEWRKCRAGNRK